MAEKSMRMRAFEDTHFEKKGIIIILALNHF